MKKMHKITEIKRKRLEEENWFDRVIQSPLEICNVDHNSLEKFSLVLREGKDNTCVAGFNNLLTADLSLLTCNRWMNNSLVGLYISFLNNLQKDCKFMTSSFLWSRKTRGYLQVTNSIVAIIGSV
jgi:hypothetical protein